MKKIIKFILGNAFIKALAIQFGNEILIIFIGWIIPKLYKQFGNRPIYNEFAEFLLAINIEDFFKEQDTIIDTTVKKLL